MTLSWHLLGTVHTAAAVGAPVWGRLVDRAGTARVLVEVAKNPKQTLFYVKSVRIDFRKDEVLLKKSHRLLDRDLALAAAMNYPLVPVHRRPRVAQLATGDELVMPGSTPGPGQIV